MTILFLFLIYVLSRQAAALVLASSASAQTAPPTVVIDSGHGGNDPGKIGVDGSLEKDLNLTIARKLKYYLETSGVQVIMTRDSDTGLYKETDSHKKTADLKARCQLINDTAPALTISIHQNSYSDAGISGAQVFYYSTSEKSRLLAEQLQEKLISMVDPTNHRAAKANDSYYMLRKTVSPTVIVECGFLSNEKECKKLQEEKYQDKIVEAIYQGIVTFAQMQESN